MNQLPNTLRGTALALAVLAGLSAPPAWTSGPYVVARVNEPFEVDGELFQPGRLSIHPLPPLSPVAMLNELRVDDRSMGLLLARAETTDAVATQDEMIFGRRSNGQLVLLSIARRGEPVRTLYRLDTSDDGTTRWRALSARRESLVEVR